MARPTVDDVREIIDTELTDIQIEAAISTAVILTETRLTYANLSDELMGEIQKWAAAHFCACADSSSTVSSKTTTEKIGEASITNSYTDSSTSFKSSGVGLLLTKWGNTAAMLDPTGTLSKLYGHTPRLYAL